MYSRAGHKRERRRLRDAFLAYLQASERSGQRSAWAVMNPILTMPALLALAMTVAINWYCVVFSARICSSGCGFFCAATRSWADSMASVINSSFQYRSPVSFTARSIGSGGLVSTVLGFACGRSMRILWVINGAVIMKMISSTNITSTRGVTLISAIGPPPEELDEKAMAYFLAVAGAGAAAPLSTRD